MGLLTQSEPYPSLVNRSLAHASFRIDCFYQRSLKQKRCTEHALRIAFVGRTAT